MRLEDLDQRPDHQVVEGSGASSGGTDQEREAKRVTFNVLDGDENDEWVETEEAWVSSPLSPDESKREREIFHCSHHRCVSRAAAAVDGKHKAQERHAESSLINQV